MKNLFFIALMLIGMVGMAQENVSIDSVQTGDNIVIKKEITILDVSGEAWTLTPGTAIVYDVFMFNDTIDHITIVFDNGTTASFPSYELKNKRKVKFCR